MAAPWKMGVLALGPGLPVLPTLEGSSPKPILSSFRPPPYNLVVLLVEKALVSMTRFLLVSIPRGCPVVAPKNVDQRGSFLVLVLLCHDFDSCLGPGPDSVDRLFRCILRGHRTFLPGSGPNPR